MENKTNKKVFTKIRKWAQEKVVLSRNILNQLA